MATTAVKPSIGGSLLVLLLTAAILLNYIDRGTVAMAAPLMKAELGLSATGFGIAVSAFFWVYAPAQLAIGWLCDRVCVYRLFGVGLAIWAVSTTLMGLTTGLFMLVVLRLFLGLGESIGFPGSSKIIARHVPHHRLGIANAGLAAAIAIGPAIGTFFGGMILVSFGWRAMFAAFGLMTMLWLLPWRWAVKPLTTQSFTTRTEPPFPPSKLLRQRALWAMSFGHFSANYGMYFLLIWLPLYLVQSRGFSIQHMALLATTLYLIQAVSALGWGWLSDHLIARGMQQAVVRKAMLVLGHAATGVCTFGIASVNSESALLAWMIGWGFCFSAGSPNMWATSQIFAGPRAAGSFIGIQNAIGNIAGIIGPIITGLIIDSTGSYYAAFVLAAAVTIAGALCFWIAVPRVQPLGIE